MNTNKILVAKQTKLQLWRTSIIQRQLSHSLGRTVGQLHCCNLTLMNPSSGIVCPPYAYAKAKKIELIWGGKVTSRLHGPTPDVWIKNLCLRIGVTSVSLATGQVFTGTGFLVSSHEDDMWFPFWDLLTFFTLEPSYLWKFWRDILLNY
jgi:hypothetical protein